MKNTTVELIFVGDQYAIADHHNSDPFPVDGVNESGRWRYPEHEGQRVIFNQSRPQFSFTAIEVDSTGIDLDEIPDGIFYVDDHFYKEYRANK